MGVKAGKSILEGHSGSFLNEATTYNKAGGVITNKRQSSAESLLPMVDNISNFFLIQDQDDVSLRQEKVVNVLDSIFGRVGCYNCGLVGLDMKLRPEDIKRFDIRATLSGVSPVIQDS